MASSQSPYKIAIIPPPSSDVLQIARDYFSSSPLTYISTNIPTTPPETRLPSDLLAALKIRLNVFVYEQKCTADSEIDTEDVWSWHWVLYARSSSNSEDVVEWMPAAMVRLVQAVPGYGQPGHHVAPMNDSIESPDYATSEVWDKSEPFAKIGRLATMEQFRGRGYGALLIEEVRKWATTNATEVTLNRALTDDEPAGANWEKEQRWKGLICAHAQSSVARWYVKQGFMVDKGIKIWKEESIDHVAVWRRVNPED